MAGSGNRVRGSTRFPQPGSLLWREAIACYLFITPALLGLLIFSLGPVIYSLAMSFMDYGVVTAPRFIGLGNWRVMFFRLREASDTTAPSFTAWAR